MSLVASRPPHSLSEGRWHAQSEHSDSESAISNHERRSTAWSALAVAYPPSFRDEESDDAPDSIASSNMAYHVPALTRGSSISSSGSSAMHTDVASALQGGFVLDSDDGILTLPSTHQEPFADLLCPFQILDCIETFSNVRDFKTHVFSHFRGHPLPSSASCFLCEAKFEQTPEDDQALAWNRMLAHMAHDHFRHGQEFGTLRPDFVLMRWMYDRKIISDHHFKRSQTCPLPTIFPAATRRASEITDLVTPEAPSPPLAASPTSTVSDTSVPASVWSRRSSYTNQTYITFAGARAERRRRDSTRPMLRQTSTT